MPPRAETGGPRNLMAILRSSGVPEPVHHGVASRIRTYFLTGLIVAGPVAITIWLVWSFVTWWTIWSAVHPVRLPARDLPAGEDPGFGLIIAFLALDAARLPHRQSGGANLRRNRRDDLGARADRAAELTPA